MDTDCDDAGALAVFNNYMNKGKIDMMAVICNAPAAYGGSCVETINRCYGNVSVPIGVVRGHDIGPDFPVRFRNYLAHVEKTSSRSYNQIVGRPVGKHASEYPSAVAVYRRVLSGSSDNSVVICCTGLLTALSLLLQSRPDQYSALSGVELVAKKVKYIVSMACLPFPDSGNERFNWKMDAVAAEYVVNTSPVPLHISSTGVGVLTGNTLSDLLPHDHPVRQAYEIYLGGPNKSRPSWDQIALLYVMGQDAELFKVKTGYRVSYQAEGNICSWSAAGNSRQDCYVELAVSEQHMAEIIEALMTEQA